ncbi:MAG: [FeFe] hydrogenase H-cluster radical SAM maturase HydE [Bacteroides sp.]|nr:[FeFe] hydrogenase H-cluster radical SAM maturase HydE [Bacteroides sp.]MCM1548488.1 [FeFe] hydrogenase H-cluster radical SAM maturase HydE [Clostridium sp.]
MSRQCYRALLEKLERKHRLTGTEYRELLEYRFSIGESEAGQQLDQELFEKARRIQKQVFGRSIYIRGLIEFTNYCRNNCYYCGIRRDNPKVERYRLTEEQIYQCCVEGYDLGYRTFVLQGGEDGYFTDQRICAIVSRIKAGFPDCAVTLSIGERSRESYARFRQAGTDRYLLRHETADAIHYGQLHPPELSLNRRKQCLQDLKDLGYQVGAGFMVGTPGQTIEHLTADLEFLQELQPHMIGIGPFISHRDTPFAGYPSGSVEETLFLLGILRLSFPKALLPATTALGTLAGDGRERGILAGANVVMPNLSPIAVREQYSLYDNKVCTREESAQCIRCIQNRIAGIGYKTVVERGDYPE